jgi:hypothetical protein
MECGAGEGCLDIDLGFSPSTNLLPIRRLTLAVGEAATVRAAWLPFRFRRCIAAREKRHIATNRPAVLS